MDFRFSQSAAVVKLPDQAAALANGVGSGMMDSSELLHLAAAAATVPWPEGAIAVEIGAYRGQTTAFLARVFELLAVRAPVLSIDPFERVSPDPLNPQGNYAAFLESIRAAGAEDRCLPLTAFSQDAAAVVPDRIGLLIVDGSHHYPVVRQDLALYAPKVFPGGVVFVDDYTESYPDVLLATDECLARDRQFSVLPTSYFGFADRQPTPSGDGSARAGVRTPSGSGSGVCGRTGITCRACRSSRSTAGVITRVGDI